MLAWPSSPPPLPELVALAAAAALLKETTATAGVELDRRRCPGAHKGSSQTHFSGFASFSARFSFLRALFFLLLLALLRGRPAAAAAAAPGAGATALPLAAPGNRKGLRPELPSLTCFRLFHQKKPASPAASAKRRAWPAFPCAAGGWADLQAVGVDFEG